MAAAVPGSSGTCSTASDEMSESYAKTKGNTSVRETKKPLQSLINHPGMGKGYALASLSL